MKSKVSLESVYKPSENVVAREVQGEFIIIPITSGIGDMGNEIFTLNATGKALWSRMDGKKNLKEIAKELTCDFTGSLQEIEKDITGLTKELLKKGIFVQVKGS